MRNDKKTLEENAKKILDDETSIQVLKSSLQTSRFSYKRLILLLIIWFLMMWQSEIIFLNGNIIDKLLMLINAVNVIIIPIFALIITGYSIFQAISTGESLYTLLTNTLEERSMFQVYNLFFFLISIQFLAIIIMNFILFVIFTNIPVSWQLPNFDQEVNERIASGLLSLYIVIIVHSLIEVKSFIYNLYQIFSTNAVAKSIQYLKNKQE
ncbi:hypothetical protein [Bacillus dakarensis]|uniref:hypothetical protein n=1 Tax=Robertmurraya dakarensis TaxID=1926278 RepID=UPI00098210A5|nr:hypothetical protein [Bacillus dakarensis]